MNCKNCHNTLKDTQKFCDECGAKVIQNRLTPKVLAYQVNEQFISIDNKFLKTFLDLFKKPERVINDYIGGTRKKYIDVLQYFAIALTLVGIQVFLMNSFFKTQVESSFEVLNSIDSATSKENPVKMNFGSFDDINKYQSIIYILTIPLYAVSSWLANFLIKPKFSYNFTEHLVLNIYYYAQIIIITALLSIFFLCFGLNYLIISGVVSLLTFIYLFYTLKRVFELDLWNGIAYFLLVMVAFTIVGIVIGILFFAISYLTGYLF